MKKIFAIILAVLMLIAIAVPALATVDACRHPDVTLMDSRSHCEMVDEECHNIVVTDYYFCNSCGKTYTETYIPCQGSHEVKLHKSTCNGTTTTLVYKCLHCTYSYTKTERCTCTNHS